VKIMKLISTLVGLAALCGVALSTNAASAMPVAIPAQAPQASNVQQASYACDEWGHCWQQSGYDGGYYHPHYWRWHPWHRYYGGGGYGWHHWHRHYGGWGYGGWHHWHPHYYGGWGYGGWHHWHHWHQW
jgi:hypothetical protein